MPLLFAVYRFLWISLFLISSRHVIVAAEFNCEVVKYTTHCEIINGKLRETDSVVICINNRIGEKYCDIEINYSKRNPVSGLSAWIEDKNGHIIRYLKNKEIVESNCFSSSFFTDEFVMRFTLKHNEYPYFVCYTYQTSYRDFLTVARWRPYIGYDVPTRSASLTVMHPDDYDLGILQNSIDLPSESSEYGMLRKCWKASYDGKVRPETFSPPCSDYLPEVVVIPRKFNYGFTGSTESWTAFGDWFYGLNAGLDELPDQERNTVLKKISGQTNINDIIKTLYHHLQDNTHYINVNVGIGGFKPYPASYVVQNRFGDCKALTLYMKALLKAAGIKSFYVLVNAGIRPGRFYPNVPSQQFNHVILAVPVDQDTIWFENTSQDFPAGYIGSFTQNRTGFLIDEKQSHLVHIPALTPEQTIHSSKLDFFIIDEGNTSVTARYTFNGPAFEKYCSLINHYNPDDQNRIIHDLLPFASFDLNAWQMIRPGRDSSSVQLMASVSTHGFAARAGSEYYFSYQPLNIPDFEPPRIRKLPVLIPYPVRIADTLIYHLPSGSNIISVPNGKKIESEFGTFQSNFVVEDKVILIIRQFELYPFTIHLDKYEEFYKFLLLIKSEEKQKVLFQ